MNSRLSLAAGLLVTAGLVVAVGAGCAGNSMGKMGSGDIVADRQRLMKLNGASLQDIQAKMKAGNVEGIAVNAETLALNARHIPALFPEGSLTEKSNAKPEIWQRRAEFDQLAQKLQSDSEKLRDAARAKNQQLAQEMLQDLGKTTCGACHTAFRKPLPRS